MSCFHDAILVEVGTVGRCELCGERLRLETHIYNTGRVFRCQVVTPEYRTPSHPANDSNWDQVAPSVWEQRA